MRVHSGYRHDLQVFVNWRGHARAVLWALNAALAANLVRILL